MRMSELAEATELPVATLKFYLREGLLEPGTPVTRTRSEYGDAHVERARLIRALIDVGGLSLAAVREVLAVIDAPSVRHLGVMEAAAQAVPLPVEPDADDARVRAWLRSRGWRIVDDDPLIGSLAAAWKACDGAGVGLDEQRLDAYADAIEGIALTDLSTVPREPDSAVRQVVLGTVLLDPVLVTLRRLAHRRLAFEQDDAVGE